MALPALETLGKITDKYMQKLKQATHRYGPLKFVSKILCCIALDNIKFCKQNTAMLIVLPEN